MALTAVEYVLIDGQRYRVARPGQYKRSYIASALSNLKGKQVQPPFLDATIPAFDSGEGTRELHDETDGYFTAQGMEPLEATAAQGSRQVLFGGTGKLSGRPNPFVIAATPAPDGDFIAAGPLALKVGRQIVQEQNNVGSNGYEAVALFNNRVYFSRRASGGFLFEWDGTTWTTRDYSATSTSQTLGMVVRLGKLYMGLNDGTMLTWDGAAFATAFTVASATGLRAFDVDAAGSIWYGYTDSAGNGVIAKWDGVALLPVLTSYLGTPRCGLILDGVFYTALNDNNARTRSARVFAIPVGAGQKKTFNADYDFAVDGGAISTIDLSTDEIPAGALIVDARVRVDTVPTSAGAATIGIGVEANSDVQAAVVISGAPWSTIGTKNLTGRPLATAGRRIKATIGTAALTAGKFEVAVDYVETRAADDKKIVAQLDDNTLITACLYRGELYFGTGWGQAVRKLDRSNGKLVEVLHAGATTPPASIDGTDAIVAMCTFNDSMYVSQVDAAAATGTRIWIRQLRGSGWHKIAYGGNDNSTQVRAIIGFNQQLLFGTVDGADGRIYRHEKTVRLTAAMLEAPGVTYGAPEVPKRYREVRLRHSPLLSGQQIDLRIRFDDGTEMSIGINTTVNSVETVFVVLDNRQANAARPRWYFTNGSAQDLFVYGAAIRGLVIFPLRQVWEMDLALSPLAPQNWVDAVADTDSATVRLKRLLALARAATVFHVIGPLREGGTQPQEAMAAVVDPTIALSWASSEADAADAIVIPLRIVQATEPVNKVANSSFEVGAAPGTGWAAFGTGTSLAYDPTTFAFGTRSLQASFNGVNASFGAEQTVTGLIPGRAYTISGYVNRSTTGGTSIIDVFEAGVLDLSAIALAPAIETTWSRYSEGFIYPANGSGTVKVRIGGEGTPSGSVRFDGIMLEEGAPETAWRESAN